MTSESLSKEEEANAWMELILSEYELDDATMKWWNAALADATPDDMDQIAKLYESAADICRQSLNPAMMRFVAKYWEGSYGQRKPEQLLLAAFRASVQLDNSSAVELFSKVLVYIGRASYQEEHLKSRGELVLVLIEKMEKVLSVVGWCLAAGIISNEQYASLIQKIFSDQFDHISDLVCCIADVAVTCRVEEDLEVEDELVYLKCQNLYDIICIPPAFEFGTTINEEEDEEEENGISGFWETEGEWTLAMKGVEVDTDEDIILHESSGVARSNGGSTSSINRESGMNDGHGDRDLQVHASTFSKVGENAKTGSGSKKRELEDESYPFPSGSIVKSNLEALLGMLGMLLSPLSCIMDEGGRKHNILSLVSIEKWLSHSQVSKIIQDNDETKGSGSGISPRRRYQFDHLSLRHFGWCLLLLVTCPLQLVSGKSGETVNLLAGFQVQTETMNYNDACDIYSNCESQDSCVCAQSKTESTFSGNGYFHCATGNCGANGGQVGDAKDIQGVCGQCPPGQFYGYFQNQNGSKDCSASSSAQNGYNTEAYDDEYIVIPATSSCETFDDQNSDYCSCYITTQSPDSGETTYCFFFVCDHAVTPGIGSGSPMSMASDWAVGCAECPAGTKLENQGDEYCVPCDAGYSTNGQQGQTSCQPCDAGQYSNATGSTECQTCPPGKVSNLGNSRGSTYCEHCGPGYGSSTNATVCEPCSAGSYSNATTEYICKEADAGYYVGESAQSLQYICPVGSYSDVGASSCTSCPFNQSTYDIGSTSPSNCTECPYGVDANTYACVNANEVSSNPLSNICWDASQLLSLGASSGVQDLYDLVYNLPHVGMNALINKTMSVIQGAADGTSSIPEIKSVLERLRNAPENWLTEVSNNFDSCVLNANQTIYIEAETELYNNQNLFQYQFGEESNYRMEWIANWICGGATFGCASLDSSACPQANTCFDPLYQYFASFLGYSGGSAFGNYQNLNTGRYTPMYSPEFISGKLSSNVETLVQWQNAQDVFQIYSNATQQLKEGFNFTVDAVYATLQVESVSTSVSQQSSYQEGNLYYRQAEHNFDQTYDMAKIVKHGAWYCPSQNDDDYYGSYNGCTSLSELIKECEREIRIDAIMHTIAETAKLAAMLVGDFGDLGALEDIGGEGGDVDDVHGEGAGGDAIGDGDKAAGGGDAGEPIGGDAPGEATGDDVNDNDNPTDTNSNTGDNNDNSEDTMTDDTNSNTGDNFDNSEDTVTMTDDTNSNTGDNNDNSEDTKTDDTNSNTGDNNDNSEDTKTDDTKSEDGDEEDTKTDDTKSEDGDEAQKKKQKEKSAAQMKLFADSFNLVGALPATSKAILQDFSLPNDIQPWNPDSQLPPLPKSSSNSNGSFENPKYAYGSYLWYLNGQRALSDSLIDMSPAKWDAIYLENEQQIDPTLLVPPNCPNYQGDIVTALTTYLANVKDMTNYGSAMTSAAMALVPVMGNIAIAIATQAAIANANKEIIGQVNEPPTVKTAPSAYDKVYDTLFRTSTQFESVSNEILSYSPAVSLTQQQYTAAKSIFQFCVSYAYMNSGQSYVDIDSSGYTANCSDFGNLYLPTYDTFNATISLFDGNSSSTSKAPQSVAALNSNIESFAANVQNSPQAVGQSRQEIGDSVQTFAIEFTKAENATYDYDLKNGTIKFSLTPSSNLLLQSTTPFGIYDVNPIVVNTQTYWRGITPKGEDGQFITTTINPIGPYMLYLDGSGLGTPYNLPPYNGTAYPNSFATFSSIQGTCPGSDEKQIGPGNQNDLKWMDGAQLQFCADYSSSLTQPYTGIASSAFLFPLLWTTWEVQIVDPTIEYYDINESELALQVVFQYVASSGPTSRGNPDVCARNCGVNMTLGAESSSPIPGSQWCDKADCNQCLASSFFYEPQFVTENFCYCNVWTGEPGFCTVEAGASPLITDAATLESKLPSLPPSVTVTVASASALLLALLAIARRSHLRQRVQYTNIPEIAEQV